MSLPPLIAVEDLMASPARTRATLSPDGTRLAFLAPWKERLNIWVADLGDPDELDRALDDARCVTADETRHITGYEWVGGTGPDTVSRWLLYRQDSGGDEHFHLYRVDLDAPDAADRPAAAVDLTPFPGARVFSHDLPVGRPGRVVVAMSHRPDAIDLYEIDIATGELTLLAGAGAGASGALAGPSGDRYGIGRDPAGDWTIEHHAPGADTARTVTSFAVGDHPYGPYPAQLTPDGTGLWVGRHGDTDRLRLVRVDLATGEETDVAGHPTFDLDTRAAVFPNLASPLIRDRQGELLGVRHSRERQVIRPVTAHFAEVLARLEALSDGDLGAISCDSDRRRWLVSFTHDRDWGATWLYDHATGDARLLFRTHPHLDPAALAPVTPVTITARDGLELPSYLTLPVGIEPAGLPLVLTVHGGPWARDAWGPDGGTQLFANRGYAVLQVNFRGSTGFGRAHMRAAIGEVGAAMHDDLVDAVEWAVAEGYADPSRVAIFGGSYGGYATLVGITRTPHLFAAAVDYVGPSNLVTFLRALPAPIRAGLDVNWYRYLGDPDDPAQEADLLARSPITHADRIVTPLLVFQGANDARVPQVESDAIVASLRARGVEVRYRVYDDEGHLFSQPENLLDMFRTIEGFLATHLAGRV